MFVRHMPISDLTSELVHVASILHCFGALTSNLSLEELPIDELTGKSEPAFEIVFEHLVGLSLDAHTVE